MNRVYVLFIMVLLSSCGGKKEQTTSTTSSSGGGAAGKDKGKGPTVVDVIIATSQTISNTIESNGTVVAAESVELHPEISGRLTYLNIPEGRFVSKGTVLARMYDADLRAQIGKSRVQLNLANLTVERYKKLLDIGGINRADYDIALNQVYGLNADIAVQEAQLTKSLVRAPFSGVIGLRQTSPGAFVTPATVLATIQKISTLKIDFTVPEEYANLVKKGIYVAVQANAGSDQRQRALIVAVEPQVNTATRNILVRALLEGGKATPGAFVKVYLQARQDKSSVLIPAAAIIPEDINKTAVVVKDGKAKYVNVETGVRQSSAVEVTKGINAGDSVVVSGVLFTRPNAPVKVRSVKKLEEVAQ